MNRILLKTALFLTAAMLPALPADAFTVSVGGRTAGMYEHGDYSYVITHEKAPFKLDIKGLEKGLTVDVSPHSRHVKYKVKGGRASLRIREQGYYIVTLSDRRKLFIFAEDALDTPRGRNVLETAGIVADGRTNVTGALQSLIGRSAGETLVFPEGTYLLSGLTIPSDTHLFLEEGAVLKADPDNVIFTHEGTHAFIEILNAHNVSICGQGAIEGNGRAVHPHAETRRNLLAVKSSDIRLEGFLSLNPARWNTHILGCDRVDIRHVKLINDWSIKNTDGFDPDCSTDVLIEDCFGHCGDDCIAIKTTDRMGEVRNLRNVTVRGCVFETKKSALKVGTETCADEMSGILFENNDVVESDRGMALYVSDGTVLHDVVYRNNRFERNYPELRQCAYHFSIIKRNKDSKVGDIHDVLIENCRYEQAYPRKPRIDNPCSARLEVEFKNLVLPEK